MIQKSSIRISFFLVLLAMFSIGLQQGYAAISQLQGADNSEQDGVYLTVNTPDFIAAGEQKTGITLVKTFAKPAYKTRLSPWLDNPAQYRNGEVAVIRYFSEVNNRVVSLEPSDLVFPFHNFW